MTIFEQLLKDYWPLIWQLAQEYTPDCREDLLQAGRIGLWQAHRRYRSEYGASFETYARHRIRGEMKDTLRRMDWRTKADRARGEKPPLAWEDLETTPYSPGPEQALRLMESIYDTLLRLDPEWRLFVLEELFFDVSCEQVAYWLRLTGGRVSQRRRQAREAFLSSLVVD